MLSNVRDPEADTARGCQTGSWTGFWWDVLVPVIAAACGEGGRGSRAAQIVLSRMGTRDAVAYVLKAHVPGCELLHSLMGYTNRAEHKVSRSCSEVTSVVAHVDDADHRLRCGSLAPGGNGLMLIMHSVS